MTYRVRNIFVAVGLAVVAALLTTFYVANYKRHVRQAESTVTVYVAKKDIPAGTPGSELAGHSWLTTAEVAKRTVVPGAISNPEQVSTPGHLSGRLRRRADHAAPLRFTGSARHPLQLHGPLRALSVPGTADQLLAGTLKDGDHVDLIANLKVTSDAACDSCFAVRDVLQNLLVLHAPPAASSSHGVSSSTALSVILAVSDRRQAQKLVYTIQNASGWTLQLRPVSNVTQPPIDVEGPASMFKDGVTPANLSHYAGSGK